MSCDDVLTLEEIGDLLTVMRQQECTSYRRVDYLAQQEQQQNYNHQQQQVIVDASWRQRIVEWMFGVVDTCGLRRDSVAVAAYYLDMCMGRRDVIASRQDFQLAAMTALQLAIKLYDSTVMKLDSMVKLGRGLFTERDVIVMEQKMLRALKWHVHPPTPVCFLRQYLRLLPDDVSPLARYVMSEVTRFVSEISVCIYKFSQYPPSVMAFAGMLIAMERIDEVILPSWQRELILDTMLTVAHMDHTSPHVQLVVQDVWSSLEKNMSIHDLMQTIDAQCQLGLQKTANPCTGCRMSVFSQSPRDVRATRRI